MARFALLWLQKFIQLSLTFRKGLIIVSDVLRGPTIPDVFCLYKNADVLVSDFANLGPCGSTHSGGKKKKLYCNILVIQAAQNCLVALQISQGTCFTAGL